MAVKRRPGDFFKGFADSFLPMYQFMQENRRADERLDLEKEGAERIKRRDVMSDATSQGQSLANRWATDPQFEATVQSLAALHPEIPIEDIRSSVMSNKPSLTQRRSAGQDRTTAWTDPSTYESTLTGFGMPERLFESLPGKVPTAEQPTPFLHPTLGALSDIQPEYPYKATPAGDITRALADAPGTFEGSREGQLYSELQAGRKGALEQEFKAQAGWKLEAAADAQRQTARISNEMENELSPDLIERSIDQSTQLLNAMEPLEAAAELARKKALLFAGVESDISKMQDPRWLAAVKALDVQEMLITKEPVLSPLLDPETNTVSWQVLTYDQDPTSPTHGQAVIRTPEQVYGEDIAANLKGKIPYSPYLFESMNDPWTKMILENFTAGELANPAAAGARLAAEHPTEVASAEEGTALVERALQSQAGPVPTGDGGSPEEIERQLAGDDDLSFDTPFNPKTSLAPDGSVRYDIDPALGATALSRDPSGIGGGGAEWGVGGEVRSLSPQQAEGFYINEADRGIATATKALESHQAVIERLRANEGNAPEEVVREFLKEAFTEQETLAAMVRAANQHRRDVSAHFGGQAQPERGPAPVLFPSLRGIEVPSDYGTEKVSAMHYPEWIRLNPDKANTPEARAMKRAWDELQTQGIR
jgi:hypothetical protein